MTRDHEQIKEDLAAYALDAVDSETRARVEAHLRGCAECAMLLAEYRAVGDIMPYALAPQEAPPEERERLLARVRAGSGAGVSLQQLQPTTAPRKPSRLATLLRWGAATAVLLALLFWNVALQSEVGRLNNRVVQAGSRGTDLLVSTNAAPQAHGQLVLSSDGKSGTLQVVGLPQLEAGQVYQFWFARPDKSRDSAGIFSVGAAGDALIAVSVPGDLQQYNQIWITREPSGGSQVPTAPHFLEGPIS